MKGKVKNTDFFIKKGRFLFFDSHEFIVF